MATKSVAERLEEKTDRNGMVPEHCPELGNCWRWTAGVDAYGYGRLQARGKTVKAHRLAWEFANGPIPDGLCVLHRCDNRGCVRPDHLFLGTNLDNIADRHEKGRDAKGDQNGSRLHPETRPRGDAHPWRRNPDVVPRGARHPFRINPKLAPRGERNGSAKLTAGEVLEIRRLGADVTLTFREIGRRFGVSSDTAYQIIHGRQWRHLSSSAPPSRKKLTDDQIRAIRQRAANGESGVDLARELGVSSALIYQVIHRKIWKHVS